MNTNNENKCICNWSKCKSLQNQCQDVLPDGHPWKIILKKKNKERNNLLTFTLNFKKRKIDELKSKAFLLGATYHLNKTKNKDIEFDNNTERTVIKIASHHFSKRVLVEQKNFVKKINPITSEEAKSINDDVLEGCLGHSEDVNLVINLLKSKSQ